MGIRVMSLVCRSLYLYIHSLYTNIHIDLEVCWIGIRVLSLRCQIKTWIYVIHESYEVATVSRIDKITGLFCKRALSKRRYSAKETYNFIDPTDRSQPIWEFCVNESWLVGMSHVSCGVATISRLIKIIGMFCKRALLKGRYSAKETYNFKKPTSCSHPI